MSARDLRGLARCNTAEARVRWHRICDAAERDEANWIAQLRAQGFTAAHPNDGWVDRQRNELRLMYPLFNDGIEVGARVMLGWPGDGDRNRPVRITAKRLGGVLLPDWVYGFEDAP